MRISWREMETQFGNKNNNPKTDLPQMTKNVLPLFQAACEAVRVSRPEEL